MKDQKTPDPKRYLLELIVNSETNGLSSFGKLHAMHVNDVAQAMQEYAQTVSEGKDREIEELRKEIERMSLQIDRAYDNGYTDGCNESDKEWRETYGELDGDGF